MNACIELRQHKDQGMAVEHLTENQLRVNHNQGRSSHCPFTCCATLGKLLTLLAVVSHGKMQIIMLPTLVRNDD